MDDRFPRWLMSSLSVYFSDVATAIPLTYYVEGVDERSDETMEEQHAELRISGPFVTKVSSNYWRVHVDINVMLTDYMTLTQENSYEIATWGGKFLEAMLQKIPIYQYGDGGALVGCLTVRRGFSDPVRLIHFGQVSRVDRVRQAVVDGKFEMILTT